MRTLKPLTQLQINTLRVVAHVGPALRDPDGHYLCAALGKSTWDSVERRGLIEPVGFTVEYRLTAAGQRALAEWQAAQ